MVWRSWRTVHPRVVFVPGMKRLLIRGISMSAGRARQLPHGCSGYESYSSPRKKDPCGGTGRE